MRKWYVVVILLSWFLLPSNTYAHNYYFAFAEIEFNEKTSRLEISLESAGHDVETALQDAGVLIQELTDHLTDTVMMRQIEKVINQQFQISSAQKCELHLIGFEVKPNGLTYFYLESTPITLTNELTIQFDWLMASFPEQQNKVTLRYKQQKYTAVFMPRRNRETIQLQ